MKIILKGKLLSTNSIYKTVCWGNKPSLYMSKAGKDKKRWYQLQAKEQWKGREMLLKDLRVDVVLYFGDKRKHDIDNFLKLALDSTQNIVFKDDAQIQELTIKKEYDKENPRITITIYEQ